MTYLTKIYTDGGCSPNPGNGGWGMCVYQGKREITWTNGGEENTTNNRMELAAMINALEWVGNHPQHWPCVIYSDSKYVVDGIKTWMNNWAKKNWMKKGTPIKNHDLWKIIFSLRQEKDCEIEWIRGHSGDVGNERADELATMGMRFHVDYLIAIADQLRRPE